MSTERERITHRREGLAPGFGEHDRMERHLEPSERVRFVFVSGSDFGRAINSVHCLVGRVSKSSELHSLAAARSLIAHSLAAHPLSLSLSSYCPARTQRADLRWVVLYGAGSLPAGSRTR